MALVKFGLGVTQMSGSVGGSTFARNRSGNYVRSRTKPVNPNTARQVAVRAALAFLTDRWAQTLTANQRIAWNLYASNVVMQNKLGESINLSGFNHYIRSNAWLAHLGAPTVDDGPVIFEIPAADPAFAVTISEGTQVWTITFDDGMDWVSEDGASLIMYNGQPQNAQRNFFDGPWQFMNSIAGNNGAPPVSPLDRAASYTYTEGQRAWVYARILRADARLSQPFTDDTFCAA